jgi:hypothetical protein
MEFLIDGWDWLTLKETAQMGIVHCSLIVGVIIFKIKLERPEK